MGLVGLISRSVMFGANKTEVHGLDGFLQLLDERSDISRRKRGLITGMILRFQIRQDYSAKLVMSSIESH